MVADFVDRTHGAHGGPSYMSGVYQAAYNAGLVLGYSAALRLDAREKELYRNALTEEMIKVTKARGGQLYMQSWSDREWISRYAGTFLRLMDQGQVVDRWWLWLIGRCFLSSDSCWFFPRLLISIAMAFVKRPCI